MAQSKATESYLGGSQGSEKCQATKCGSVAPAILSCLIHSSAAYHPHPYLTLFLRQARVPQALISRPSCPCALNLLPTLSCLDQPHLIFKSYPQCLFLQEVFPDNHKIWPGPPTMGSHSFPTSPIPPQNCFEMAYLTAKCISPVRREALRGQSPVLLYSLLSPQLGAPGLENMASGVSAI